METVDQNENPYVAVVSRKSRNLKKKLERILKVEAQLKEGKKLNEEQLILVASKSSLEKALTDVESIKTQLEEVAKQELLLKEQQTGKQENNSNTDSLKTEKIDSSTVTHEVELTTNSTQCEQQDNDTASASDTVNAVIDYSEVLRGHLIKLLKLFHVCSRYSNLSGGIPLPADINYFGKCLLGETTLDSFTKALNQSVKNAELYLDEDLGSQYEAIRGMSYSQISDIIDSLVLQLPQPDSTLQQAPTPPPQSPQINFFADGDLNEQLEEQGQFNSSYNNNNVTIESGSSPFPLPPSAVVMYDQWNNNQNNSTVSPSTLEVSSLSVSGNNETKVESTSDNNNNNQNLEVVESSKKEEEDSNNITQSENRESGGRRGRGYGRGRGSKGRGRGGRSSSKENNTQNQNSNNNETESHPETKESNENKKGISWGGQQKKAGGALATVSGTPEVNTTSTSSTTQEKEGGRGSGRGGRGRGRWTSGRGRGSKEFDSTTGHKTTSTTTTTTTTTTDGTSSNTTTNTKSRVTNNSTEGNTSNDKGRGNGAGRGNNRGRGRGYSRGEGRGGNGGRFQSREKSAVQPSTA